LAQKTRQTPLMMTLLFMKRTFEARLICCPYCYEVAE
jgi:hypothetical protein